MGNPLDFSTPGMLAALPYNFPPLEAGLNEYRQRSLDWNVSLDKFVQFSDVT